MKPRFFRLLAVAAATVLFSPICPAAVEVSMPWAKSWQVVTPDTAAGFGFRLTNPGPETVQGIFSVTLTPPSGTDAEVSRPVSLRPGETLAVPCSLTGKEKGVWKLSYVVTGAGNAELLPRKTTQFALMDPAGPTKTRPVFIFGVSSHTSGLAGDVQQKHIDAAAFIGVKAMRDSRQWNHIQRTPDQWDWASMDGFIDRTQAAGIEDEFLLAFNTKWAAPEAVRDSKDWKDWGFSAPEIGAWRKFVSTAAERYKGRIRLWEPWNEPDLQGFWRGTTEQYIELLKISEEELHRVDPKNLVMSGGFATLSNHQGRRLNPDLQERAMMAVGPKLDFYAIHEHSPFPAFAEIVDGPHAQLMARLPAPVPALFFNETAIHSLNGTELEQASTLIKKATFARSRKAAGYFWYDLVDDGVEPNNPEHHFGLLAHDLTPKPDYVAFATFARLVVPRPFLQQLEMPTNRWFFVFGDAAEKLVVYWNEDSGSQSEQVMLRLPGATKAESIDINGNVSPQGLVNGAVTLSAVRQPHLLLVHGATAVEPAGRLVGPSKAFFGAPGAEVPVSCEFTNPTDTALPVHVQWELPRALRKTADAPAKVDLAARGKGSSTLTVRLPEGADYRFGSEAKVRVNYEFAGTSFKGSLLIPVHYGTISLPNPQAGAPDIVLDRREQLFSFIENDPHMLDYRWKGPDDLSAKAWISADASYVTLRVEVKDNKHSQPNQAVEMWKGDSVQSMMVIPGGNKRWQVDFAQGDDGQLMCMVNRKVVVAGWPEVKLDVQPAGEGRVYVARLSRKDFGLTDDVLKGGFRFDLAVNDNDGQVRAHALQLAPGIVEGGGSPEAFPYVQFKEVPAAKP